MWVFNGQSYCLCFLGPLQNRWTCNGDSPNLVKDVMFDAMNNIGLGKREKLVTLLECSTMNECIGAVLFLAFR